MKFLPYIVIAGLVVYIFFIKSCQKCPECKEGTATHDTLLLYTDTGKHVIEVPVPYPVASKPDTVPMDVDTLAILQDYYAHYFYEQVIADTNLTVTLNDTVSQNKIMGRGFSYRWLKPTTMIYNDTTIAAQNKFKMFAGLDVGANLTGDNFSLTPNLKFITKKDALLEIGYDIPNQMPLLGVAIKIRLKK